MCEDIYNCKVRNNLANTNEKKFYFLCQPASMTLHGFLIVSVSYV